MIRARITHGGFFLTDMYSLFSVDETMNTPVQLRGWQTLVITYEIKWLNNKHHLINVNSRLMCFFSVLGKFMEVKI